MGTAQNPRPERARGPPFPQILRYAQDDTTGLEPKTDLTSSLAAPFETPSKNLQKLRGTHRLARRRLGGLFLSDRFRDRESGWDRACFQPEARGSGGGAEQQAAGGIEDPPLEGHRPPGAGRRSARPTTVTTSSGPRKTQAIQPARRPETQRRPLRVWIRRNSAERASASSAQVASATQRGRSRPPDGESADGSGAFPVASRAKWKSPMARIRSGSERKTKRRKAAHHSASAVGQAGYRHLGPSGGERVVV